MPNVSYYPPIIATLLATLLIILVTGMLTLFALAKASSQLNSTNAPNAGDNILSAGFCGILGIVGVLATLYFIVALVKGLRDLAAPVHYARGTVLDKRILGGRKTGNWMGVGVRYSGPDLETASTITDEQRAASPDRSTIVQPRFSEGAQGSLTPRVKRGASYLPANRLADRTASSTATSDPSAPRVIYRVDPASFEALSPDEEVLIAHSRFLQHIYYVAHLRGGEWESYRNKQLI